MGLITAIMHINTNCNSKCITCDWWKSDVKDELTFNEIIELSREFKKNAISQIMITGGEPTLHKDLVQIIDLLYQEGFDILLNTNGFLIENLKEATLKKISKLVISMDASDAEKYKKIRGVDLFEKIIKNVNEINKRNLTEIYFRCTLQKENIFEITNIKKLADKLCVKASFNPIDASSDNFGRESVHNLFDLIPSLDELTKFELYIENNENLPEFSQSENIIWDKDKLKKLIIYFKTFWGIDHKSGNCPCTIPYSSIVIDANGDIKSCFYEKLYNFRESGIENFFHSRAYLERIERLKRNKKCENCRGKIFA